MKKFNYWPAYASMAILLISLFLIVLAQTEQRRLGYNVLKLRSKRQALATQKAELQVNLAKKFSPHVLVQFAEDVEKMSPVLADRVIHLAEPESREADR